MKLPEAHLLGSISTELAALEAAIIKDKVFNPFNNHLLSAGFTIRKTAAGEVMDFRSAPQTAYSQLAIASILRAHSYVKNIDNGNIRSRRQNQRLMGPVSSWHTHDMTTVTAATGYATEVVTGEARSLTDYNISEAIERGDATMMTFQPGDVILVWSDVVHRSPVIDQAPKGGVFRTLLQLSNEL